LKKNSKFPAHCLLRPALSNAAARVGSSTAKSKKFVMPVINPRIRSARKKTSGRAGFVFELAKAFSGVVFDFGAPTAIVLRRAWRYS
jgi:hypothetical protein